MTWGRDERPGFRKTVFEASEGLGLDWGFNEATDPAENYRGWTPSR
jgi:hypothetical protein